MFGECTSLGNTNAFDSILFNWLWSKTRYCKFVKPANVPSRITFKRLSPNWILDNIVKPSNAPSSMSAIWLWVSNILSSCGAFLKTFFSKCVMLLWNKSNISRYVAPSSDSGVKCVMFAPVKWSSFKLEKAGNTSVGNLSKSEPNSTVKCIWSMKLSSLVSINSSSTDKCNGGILQPFPRENSACVISHSNWTAPADSSDRIQPIVAIQNLYQEKNSQIQSVEHFAIKIDSPIELK